MAEYRCTATVRAENLHMEPCMDIVYVVIKYMNDYHDISIMLENPEEKGIEESIRAESANAFFTSELIDMVMLKGDNIDVIVSGEYTPDILEKCGIEIKGVIERKHRGSAGDALCKR